MVRNLDARFDDCPFPRHVCGFIATGYDFTDIKGYLYGNR